LQPIMDKINITILVSDKDIRILPPYHKGFYFNKDELPFYREFISDCNITKSSNYDLLTKNVINMVYCLKKTVFDTNNRSNILELNKINNSIRDLNDSVIKLQQEIDLLVHNNNRILESQYLDISELKRNNHLLFMKQNN